MENVEGALENGVSAFKQMLHDGRYLTGATAIESHLVNKLETYANTQTGLEQYSCLKYGQAFEIFPKILLDNAGMDYNQFLPDIVSANTEGAVEGINVFEGQLRASKDLGIFDSYAAKVNAIKLATHAALTVLRVDQIIMAKPAGGPKMKSNSGWDNED